MEPARGRFAEVLARQAFARPTAAVFSNTLGAQYPEDPKEIAALLESHLVRPVKFVDEIRAMYEQGARIFVEVGPKGVLTGLARQILDGKDARFIQIDSDRNGLTQLLHALAQLAAEGVPVDASQLMRGRNTQPEAKRKETGWMVNGLKAFPTKQPPRVVEPLDLMLRTSIQGTGDVQGAGGRGQGAVEPVPAPQPVAYVPAPGTQHPAPTSTQYPTPTMSPISDAVMLQFQQLMKQILQAQTTIMTAYMQGAPLAGTQQPAPAIAPLVVAPPPPAPVVVSAPAPPPPAPAPAPVVVVAPARPAAQRNFVDEIREVAAERTGYPPEMLDMDAGIESDLGIDSIKRVEILTALQKRGTAEQQQAAQAIMDKLTSARTLREIANFLAESMPAAPATPAPAPASPQPVAAIIAPAASAARDFVAELREVAAERTGYPPEMLDMDAGIESDLGIDSIKRVEILTALQKRGTAAEQQAAQAIMEKLTSARTLREIANLLAGQLPAAPAPAPDPAPSTQHPTPSVSTQRNYIEELRRIASERTGYEPDMLELDAGIEADLGIDSIKRVEILTAFSKACSADEQTKLQAVMETLTSARTLREIGDRIAAALGGAVPATPSPVVAAVAPDVPRFILTPVAKPRRQTKPQYYRNRVCVITDDETGVAAGIADELNRAGERALLLRHSPDATIGDGSVYATDLTDPADIDTILRDIRQQHGPIGAVIHLLPLRSNGSATECDFSHWREMVRLDVRSLYALARATENELKQAGAEGGALLAAITARGGEFGLRPNGFLPPPTHFGVADFIKTLALEFNGVQCKVVDLDATDPVPILQQKLLDELTSTDDTLQVGLPGDRRLTVMPQLAPLDTASGQAVQRDWVFLVTGGARGVTAEIARQVAQRYQPTLILAGASPLPSGPEPGDTAGVTEIPKLKAALTARLRASSATVKPAAVEAALQRLLKDREITQSIESLRRTGARVEYHSLDVRNDAVFGELIDGIYQRHGRLDVVVHGAGIIEDKLIKDKTPESFDRVVHTKADSAFVLSRKLRPEGLRCLLLMSSVTAAFGNRGQADYAIANGIMNGLATILAAQWPAHVVAMNWGPWGQSGMVSEEVRQQFLSRGIQMIPLDGGAEAAIREIQAAAPFDSLVALGEGPWRQVALPAGRAQAQVLGSLK
jgi:NAD(P)-dependent dehydrogenase (short-subunit alcohol dehydrogenase family)/acyl carrier protein